MSEDPRSLAHQILAGSRYHEPGVPRPLHGLLQRLGDVIGSAQHAADSLLTRIERVTPGGGATLWAVVATAVIVLAVVLARRTANRVLAPGRRGARAGGMQAPDGDELERAAARAEADGMLELALRLRFQAGLVRLGERKLIEYRPSVRTHDVAARLRSPEFDALARRFDEVTYGGVAALPEDPAKARAGWAAVLASS